MRSYRLLELVLKEQCNVNVSDDKNPVEVKNPKGSHLIHFKIFQIRMQPATDISGNVINNR